jgi:serine/threonine protein kinase
LQAAHEAGVIHRDLKPSNIFVTPLEDAQRGGTRDFVKIRDFGLAKLKLPPDAQKLTDHDMTVGTPAYASPEQLQCHPIDGRADIYALGCIAFELFTGKQLFTGPAIRVMVCHVEDHAPRVRQRNPRARISDDMEQLIARCLEKSPMQVMLKIPYCQFPAQVQKGRNILFALWSKRSAGDLTAAYTLVGRRTVDDTDQGPKAR